MVINMEYFRNKILWIFSYGTKKMANNDGRSVKMGYFETGKQIKRV